MTESSVAFTDLEGEAAAANEIARQIQQAMRGGAPDAVILFISPKYRYRDFLRVFKEASGARVIVGCSSAGEFVSGKQGENAISAIALRSDEMRFSASFARGLRQDREHAAATLAAPLRGWGNSTYPHKSLLVLTDALAGYTDDLIEQLNLATAGDYQIFGGGAGENASFSTTHVFCGTEAETNSAVALEILSEKPLGIGVQHGWQPVGEPLRVTESQGMRLVSLNTIPAIEVFEKYARETGQALDRNGPIPFFLNNTLGVLTPTGYKLRVPLAIQPDGSIFFASDVPEGSVVSIMNATQESASDAAVSAVQSALKQMQGHRPRVALFFDCVATRLRLGDEFKSELSSMSKSLGDSVPYAGCNTYGQIARVRGQFSGFHNCTAVVCVLPE
jgi:hypothetical protein